jgi:hypothetical protein
MSKLKSQNIRGNLGWASRICVVLSVIQSKAWREVREKHGMWWNWRPWGL